MSVEYFPIDKFQLIETPFYYYDIPLLYSTINEIKKEIANEPFVVHYALKANSNARLLQEISSSGLGADCVSGNEIKKAVDCGFDPAQIVFAGVGKTDNEINLGLDLNIFSFNVESLHELKVLNELAKAKKKVARVALRINPNIDANTHSYITTGLEENKFGIEEDQFLKILGILPDLSFIDFIGVHFHIGSQISDMNVYQNLCYKINEIQRKIEKKGFVIEHINVGGGLGVDYKNPDKNKHASFSEYFNVFSSHLEIRRNQKIHFELGRSIVAQCGTLVSRVLYLKESREKRFVIIDAGMTDLVRPALYKAYHQIENLTSSESMCSYDIVGPVCESSDTFAVDYKLNKAKRGDLLAIRSSGAYGQSMSSTYNCRELAKAYYSDTL